MKLVYIGKTGQFINGVPARDLASHEVQKIAREWRLSLAETEGLLIQSKLYKAEAPPQSDTHEAQAPASPKKKTRKEGA